MSNVIIIGTGYVGLVTAVCLAKLGNTVVCHDIDARKIDSLKKGKAPFYEPDLGSLLEKGIKNGQLSFTNSLEKALTEARFIFICVGTPPKRDGSADLRAYFSVIEKVGKVLGGEDFKSSNDLKSLSSPIILNKSTVPIGTACEAQKILQTKALVVSNPEFLREGKAIADFMQPDRIVLGKSAESDEGVVYGVKETLLKLYKPFECPKIITNWETAEMIKYASNAFLATKISFINEIANVCEKVGADVVSVAEGMGYDKRIGSQFLKAGIGYGGSCFPKDVRALTNISINQNYNFKLLKAVIEVNNQQRSQAVVKIATALQKPYKNKIVAVLGLAFKPHTDDVRESAGIFVIKELAKRGIKVKTYDPAGTYNAKRELKGTVGVTFTKDVFSALQGVDAVFLATEWDEFLSLDWGEVKSLMRGNTVIDGRNALNKEKVRATGLRYAGFGVL